MEIGDRCRHRDFSGTFEVIGKKGTGRSKCVHLKNLSNQKESFWVYEANCTVSFTQKFENVLMRKAVKEKEVSKILAKQKGK